MQEKRHDRVVEMRLCFFLGKVGDYNVSFVETRMCRSTYYINRLSGYIASSGKKYKNHAATIRRWAADDEAKKAPKQKIPDYSYREGESL